jgi:serine protease AprX
MFRRRSMLGASLLVALSLALAALPPAQVESIVRAADRAVAVIVRAPDAATARAAVGSVGGRVTRALPIVDSVVARVQIRDIAALRRLPQVWSVTPDERVGFLGSGDSSQTARRIQKVVRSDGLWREGVTGAGVNVAVLDTGVYAQHPDLQGRVVHCEDFSHEARGQARCADTFGHGTFMAGLIAGDGTSSNGKYMGAAPDAGLVSVKVAGYDGEADVSNVLAGIQWVVAHRSDYDIRVLNLSLGTDSAQDYRLSPLDFAVEKAWKAGIVVVVSAGNTGPNASTVMKPGDDPFVITVGASNDEGSTTVSDDTVPIFSGRGPTRSNGFAKPDVVSPGVHTVSLRSPGSAIDQKFGATARVDDGYFRGTGTSMSTATVSGVVAQILQRNPGLTPDQVKYRLTATARQIADRDATATGNGVIDAYAAATSASTASANQNIQVSSGLGGINLDRGNVGVQLVTPAGSVTLNGEFVAQTDPARVGVTNPSGLVPYAAADYTTTGWDGSSWQGSSWQGSSWQAGAWAGSSWQGSSWQATIWNGSSWQGSSWQNATWQQGSSWQNVDWDGSSWQGSSWQGSSWQGSSWQGSSWQSAWYAASWS